MHIYSNGPSKGAAALAREMGIKRIKPKGSRFRGGPGKVVINWGNGGVLPKWEQGVKIINPPSAITVMSDKLRFFQTMGDADTVLKWTTDRDQAVKWLKKGYKVVARTVLQGSSGAGIVVASDEAGLPNARLYTRYMKKSEEYRVHVVDGKVIDVAQKKRKLEVPDDEVNWSVRTHNNGFIYAREGVKAPKCVEEVSLSVMKKLKESNVTFGAVDVIYNVHNNKALVCEVNSAPGLEGTTVKRYAAALSKIK